MGSPVSLERFFTLLTCSFFGPRARAAGGFFGGLSVGTSLTVLEDDSELEEFRLRFSIREGSRTGGDAAIC